MLAGGLGRDILNGGTEAGTYRFGADDTGLGTAADHIVGFSRAQGDKIEFNMSGISASSFVGTEAFASSRGKEFGYTKLTSGAGVKSTSIRVDFDDDGALTAKPRPKTPSRRRAYSVSNAKND